MPSLLPAMARPGRRWPLILVLVFVVLGAAWVWANRFGEPEDFEHMEAQFKYGSIGADHPFSQAPLPYWLWKVLPELFDPDRFIPQDRLPTNGKKGYEAFGLVVEAERERPRGFTGNRAPFERPIGFSRRRVFGVDFVGLNCAFCHV